MVFKKGINGPKPVSPGPSSSDHLRPGPNKLKIGPTQIPLILSIETDRFADQAVRGSLIDCETIPKLLKLALSGITMIIDITVLKTIASIGSRCCKDK